MEMERLKKDKLVMMVKESEETAVMNFAKLNMGGTAGMNLPFVRIITNFAEMGFQRLMRNAMIKIMSLMMDVAQLARFNMDGLVEFIDINLQFVM